LEEQITIGVSGNVPHKENRRDRYHVLPEGNGREALQNGSENLWEEPLPVRPRIAGQKHERTITWLIARFGRA
jgi:hypothetical protein